MIDLQALLYREGPSMAAIEAEATRLAQGQALLSEAKTLCADLNTLMDELCKRGFEVVVDVNQHTIGRGGHPYVPEVTITAKRVMG